VSTLLSSMTGALGDLIYPPECPWCHRTSDRTARLCAMCRERILPNAQTHCRRCDAPVGPHLDTAAGCIHCRNESWRFERVYSIGPYQDAMRSACLSLKQRGRGPLVAAMAAELMDRWQSELTERRIDAIVPVPHHWWDRAIRPDLPPETLAHFIASRLGLPVQTGFVRKRRRTKAQASLSATDRRANLKGAFAPVGGVRLEGGRILLVDDVLTTGTTADRVTRVLRELGAESVVVAVVARGLGL
jgi:ComF family protein